MFLLLAAVSTPAVWSALSLSDSSIVPTYAVVTLCVVLQPNLGKGAGRHAVKGHRESRRRGLTCLASSPGFLSPRWRQQRRGSRAAAAWQGTGACAYIMQLMHDVHANFTTHVFLISCQPSCAQL